MWIEKYGRFWKLYDTEGNLICVAVYKRGALEVAKRLGAPFCAQIIATGHPPPAQHALGYESVAERRRRERLANSARPS